MPAAVRGYDIAGKTGTAQKPGRGGYAEGEYMASFVGFFPSQQPRLTMAVILDDPTPIYGSATAAPLFGEIARYAAQRYRIAPRRGDSIAFPAKSATALESPELRAARDALNGVKVTLPPTTVVGGSTTETVSEHGGAAARPTAVAVPTRAAAVRAEGTPPAGDSSQAQASGPAAATGSAGAPTVPTPSDAEGPVTVRAPAVTSAEEP